MSKIGLIGTLLLFALLSCPSDVHAFCLAPFAIADRWDDSSPIQGYVGGARKTPDWRNDGIWEGEAFTDLNEGGFYDPGEPYSDANGNGIYDAEAYSQTITGYVLTPTPENVISPGGDLGLQITLVPASSPGDEKPGHYLSLQSDCAVYLSVERPNGADLRSVDSFFRSQIAADPSATWDPLTKSVVGSQWCISPRLVPVPLYDPRRPLRDAHGTIQATKIITMFLETVVDKGSATIRVASFPLVASAQCVAAPTTSSARVANPARATWGELKAIYR